MAAVAGVWRIFGVLSVLALLIGCGGRTASSTGDSGDDAGLFVCDRLSWSLYRVTDDVVESSPCTAVANSIGDEVSVDVANCSGEMHYTMPLDAADSENWILAIGETDARDLDGTQVDCITLHSHVEVTLVDATETQLTVATTAEHTATDCNGEDIPSAACHVTGIRTFTLVRNCGTRILPPCE